VVVVVCRFSWSVSRLGPRGQSWWSVALRGQSAFFLVVAVSLRVQSFFLFSRLGRRGQSSRSVVLRGWCLYSMVVMHTYLLKHMAGENRGQCLDKCVGLGRTRVGGHETRPKPKPNVDYYLVSYLILLLLLLLNFY